MTVGDLQCHCTPTAVSYQPDKLYIWVAPWDQIKMYKQTNKRIHDDYQVMMVNLPAVVVVGGSGVVEGVEGIGL